MKPSSAGRVLGTTFQISKTDDMLVFYTIELSVTAQLLATQFAQVVLLCDSSPTPTVQAGEAFLASAQTSGISLVPIQTTARQMIAALIPAGCYVTLVAAGGGSATLVNQMEVVT